MRRRNFLQSILIGVVGSRLPYSTRGIRKRKETWKDEFHEDIAWDRIYDVNRKDVKDGPYDGVCGMNLYAISYEIFKKYKDLKKFTLKIRFKDQRYRLVVKLSNTSLMYFKEWVDYEIKPVCVWFEYQNSCMVS